MNLCLIKRQSHTAGRRDAQEAPLIIRGMSQINKCLQAAGRFPSAHCLKPSTHRRGDELNTLTSYIYWDSARLRDFHFKGKYVNILMFYINICIFLSPHSSTSVLCFFNSDWFLSSFCCSVLFFSFFSFFFYRFQCLPPQSVGSWELVSNRVTELKRWLWLNTTSTLVHRLQSIRSKVAVSRWQHSNISSRQRARVCVCVCVSKVQTVPQVCELKPLFSLCTYWQNPM